MKPRVLIILRSPFEECRDIFRGFMQYQAANRPWLVSLESEGGEATDLNSLRSTKWQAVISRHTTRALVRACEELDIPLVDLNDIQPMAGITRIRSDHFAVGRVGAKYFLGKRIKHFGYCGYSGQPWSRERREGFLDSLRAAGRQCSVFDCKEAYGVVHHRDLPDAPFLDCWLRSLPAGTGVMGCDDPLALRVLRAAQAAGIGVPEQLAVLGANNNSSRCELADPSLSSVAPDFVQVGLRAAEYLVKALGGSREKVDLCIEPVGVATRKSTDILAQKDRNVAMAVDHIRVHACNGLTVDEILGKVHLSRSQLEHRFRRFVGRSPQVEIRRVQIEKIKTLLAETDSPLKDIAELTGFEYVEYMCVVFKRITGVTPGRYRRSVQANDCAAAIA